MASHRRWFQFRLSTWFVLIGILAWGMMLGLKGNWMHGNDPTMAEFDGGNLSVSGRFGAYVFALRIDYPSSMLYPALALAAFVAWKAAWANVRRARARPTTEPIDPLVGIKVATYDFSRPNAD